MKDTIPFEKIRNYLQGGIDPFSDKKTHQPLSEEQWLALKKKYIDIK